MIVRGIAAATDSSLLLANKPPQLIVNLTIYEYVLRSSVDCTVRTYIYPCCYVTEASMVSTPGLEEGRARVRHEGLERG